MRYLLDLHIFDLFDVCFCIFWLNYDFCNTIITCCCCILVLIYFCFFIAPVDYRKLRGRNINRSGHIECFFLVNVSFLIVMLAHIQLFFQMWYIPIVIIINLKWLSLLLAERFFALIKL